VDARDPLFYHCRDLDRYVKELSEAKMNVVLLNKADFLTREQRREWAEHFE
jgi:large subunit GTPase 1